ncbi:hypothetical protein VTO42DRAFT_7067 [Malbranchea cinnamomea]
MIDRQTVKSHGRRSSMEKWSSTRWINPNARTGPPACHEMIHTYIIIIIMRERPDGDGGCGWATTGPMTSRVTANRRAREARTEVLPLSPPRHGRDSPVSDGCCSFSRSLDHILTLEWHRRDGLLSRATTAWRGLLTQQPPPQQQHPS